MLYMVNTGNEFGRAIFPSDKANAEWNSLLTFFFSVVDPDGVLRTVRYTADKHNGFQAQIITNGKVHGDSPNVYHQGPSHGSHGSHNSHDESDEDDDEYY